MEQDSQPQATPVISHNGSSVVNDSTVKDEPSLANLQRFVIVLNSSTANATEPLSTIAPGEYVANDIMLYASVGSVIGVGLLIFIVAVSIKFCKRPCCGAPSSPRGYARKTGGSAATVRRLANKFREQTSLDWFQDYRWNKDTEEEWGAQKVSLDSRLVKRDIGRKSMVGVARKTLKEGNNNQGRHNEQNSSYGASRRTCHDFVIRTPTRIATKQGKGAERNWNQTKSVESEADNVEALEGSPNVNRELSGDEDAAVGNDEHLTYKNDATNSEDKELWTGDEGKRTEYEGNKIEDIGEKVEESPLEAEADSSNEETISWSEDSEDESHDEELLDRTKK